MNEKGQSPQSFRATRQGQPEPSPADDLGTKCDELTSSSYFDGWGYAHLYRNKGGKMTGLDTYAIPEAHDPAYASDSGDLSIHEVAASGVRPLS